MREREREREREKRSNFQSMVFGAPLLDHQLHLSHFDLPEDVSKEKKAISCFVDLYQQSYHTDADPTGSQLCLI